MGKRASRRRQRRVAPAKLTPPRLPKVLERTRLYRVLDRARRRPVVWITGPPGAGKTTLVASYLKARRLPLLWYRMDEGDGDPSSFFHYLAVAAKALAPRFRKPLPVLTPEYMLGLPTFTRRYFQELIMRLPRRAVLVLDNYQEVPASSVLHQVLPCAAHELPEQMSLIVVSRQKPPAPIAKLEAERAITVLDPETVELSKAETKAMIHLHAPRGSGRQIKSLVDDVCRRMGGWAAGIVLTLEYEKSRSVLRSVQVGKTPEALFHYFAGEVMERLATDVQTLLLKTSLLSDITVPMAERLTGLSMAGEVLASLYRSRYFTEQRSEPELSYRYHPLFREFLQQKAREVLGSEEYRRLQRAAAELLVDAGRIEEGVMLLRMVQDWEGLSQVILTQAANLIAQGRVQTLEGWIGFVPEAVRHEIPWLTFWLATTRVSFNPDEAYGLFDRILKQFRTKGDQAGLLLSWCGAVRAVMIRWTGMNRLDTLLELFSIIHPEGTPYPSIEIEAHVADCMAGAVMQRQPWQGDAKAWLDRAVSLSDHLPPAVQTGSRYMTEIYYLWTGDFASATAGLAQFSKIAAAGQWNPVTTIFFHATSATLGWFSGDIDLCRTHVEKAKALISESGLHVWDGLVLSQGVAGELMAGDLVRAEALLTGQDVATVRLGGIHRAHFEHMFAWFRLLQGNLQSAWEHVQLSNNLIAAEGGFTFGEGINGLLTAQILYDLGKELEATDWLDRVMHIGRLMRSDVILFGGWVHTAERAFDRGDRSAGLEAFQKALVIGEARDFFQYPGMKRNVIAALSARALEAGIMVPSVQRMIQKHRFTAPPQARAVEAWPWQVKISTLGRFAVLVDGQPLILKRKSPHRLFDLLKAIIARGGGDVPITQLMDVFWSEVDGDTARENFDKSLQRLRHLLHHEQVIVIKAGKVSLNRECCWVDVLAFEDMAKEIGHVGINGDAERAIHLAEWAQSLYSGPFLGEEDHMAWFELRRERVRTLCAQVVGRLCDHWVAEGSPEQAIACLKSIIAVDGDMTPLVSARLDRLHGQAEDQIQFPRQR